MPACLAVVVRWGTGNVLVGTLARVTTAWATPVGPGSAPPRVELAVQLGRRPVLQQAGLTVQRGRWLGLLPAEVAEQSRWRSVLQQAGLAVQRRRWLGLLPAVAAEQRRWKPVLQQAGLAVQW